MHEFYKIQVSEDLLTGTLERKEEEGWTFVQMSYLGVDFLGHTFLLPFKREKGGGCE